VADGARPDPGRYFLLTGEEIGVEEQKRLGIVNEILAPTQADGPRLGARPRTGEAAAHGPSLFTGRAQPAYSAELLDDLATAWRSKVSR